MTSRADGQEARIALAGGGAIIVRLDVDLLTLTPDDRDLVFRVVDLVKAFAR